MIHYHKAKKLSRLLNIHVWSCSMSPLSLEIIFRLEQLGGRQFRSPFTLPTGAGDSSNSERRRGKTKIIQYTHTLGKPAESPFLPLLLPLESNHRGRKKRSFDHLHLPSSFRVDAIFRERLRRKDAPFVFRPICFLGYTLFLTWEGKREG